MAATAEEKTVYVGIDVSKDKLDVHMLPSGEAFWVTREEAGIAELVRRLENPAPAVIAIEATGGFEAAPAVALAAAGLKVAVVNPKQVHNFAKALGLNAKTDALDACVIARFAAAVKPEARPLKDAETAAFAGLLTRRRQLVEMLTAEKNRALRMASNKTAQKSIRRIIEALERELARIDAGIDGAAEASLAWGAKEELLRTMPGVGKIVARTLLAEMPELGTLSGKEAAALAGLAPWTRQSGKWKGKSMISGGRRVCRTILYLAAMSAVQYNPDLAAFKIRLLNAGRAPKVILIAAARKILVTLNAMLRDNTPWTPKTS